MFSSINIFCVARVPLLSPTAWVPPWGERAWTDLKWSTDKGWSWQRDCGSYPLDWLWSCKSHQLQIPSAECSCRALSGAAHGVRTGRAPCSVCAHPEKPSDMQAGIQGLMFECTDYESLITIRIRNETIVCLHMAEDSYLILLINCFITFLSLFWFLFLLHRYVSGLSAYELDVVKSDIFRSGDWVS